MIPNNTVYRTTVRDPYQFYDTTVYNPFVYKVRAGLDIRDTSLGMNAVDWTLWYDVELKTFNLDKDGKLALELGLPGYGKLPDGVAFAFDEDMRLYWGYSYLDITKETTVRSLEFNWHNPQQNRIVKMILNDVHSMHVVLDDPNISSTATSDIILLYVRNSDRIVCARYQSELFAVEYPLFLLRTGETFVRVDLTTSGKLQFEIGKLQKPYTWVKLLSESGTPIFDHNRNPIWVVENTMSETYNGRPALSDLSYQRTVTGNELFIISDKGEEKLLTLTSATEYMKTAIRIGNYYQKDEANKLFSLKTDVYTKSETHDLYEVKDNCYDKPTSDSKYELKGTAYAKVDAELLFAKKDNVYTREQADSYFAPASKVISLAEADARYLQKINYQAPVTDMSNYLTKDAAALKYATVDSVYTTGYIEANFVNVKVLDKYYTKTEVEAMLSVKDKTLTPFKENLLNNGIFELRNLEGWNPNLLYTEVLSPRSPYGGALFKGKCQRLVLDQLVPMLVNKHYTVEYVYNYLNKMTPGIGVKLAFICYDKDQYQIAGMHYSFDPVSVTRLIAPLKQGDTVMRVSSTNGWLSIDRTELGRGNILFFNYKNKTGFVYDDLDTPYTRNIAHGEYIKFKSTETSAADEFINVANGIIQLSKPWDYKNPNTSDGSFPIGTRIARSKPFYGSDEFELRCLQAVGKQFNSPDNNALTSKHGFTMNYNNTGGYESLLVPPGTVYMRPVLYPNYNYMADKTEFGLEMAAAPDATNSDVLAFTQLYLRLDM